MGGTFELLADHLPRLGITTPFVPASRADRAAAVITADTRVVYFETPTNPMLDVIDIAAVGRAAHAAGALVVVDNTFASPVNQQPRATARIWSSTARPSTSVATVT